MKYLHRIVFLGFLLTFVPIQGQILKNLKKKAQRAVERKVENRATQEIEKSTDRVLDSILEPSATESEERSTNNGMNGLFGEQATIEGSYQFNMEAALMIETFGRKKQTTEVIQGYGDNAVLTRQKKQQNVVIIDFDNRSAIMLDTKKNSGQALSLDFMEKMMGGTTSADTTDDISTVRKTGNTKNLHGYMCEEYEILSEDSKTLAWFAPEVDFSGLDYMKGFAKLMGGNQVNTTSLPENIKGYVMEMTQYDADGKMLTKITVTDIRKEKKTYLMSDYSIQKI